MTQHTPWHIGSHVSPAEPLHSMDAIRVWGSDGAGIADVCIRRRMNGHNGAEQDIARLIAAAPDLLAALETVLPDLQHYVSMHGPGPDRRLEQARGAIERAKGE